MYDFNYKGGCEGCIHYDYCGYFDFDTSGLTEEEASKRLEELHKIDMIHDEFDREFFKNYKAYVCSGSVLTKEQTDKLFALAEKPVKIEF